MLLWPVRLLSLFFLFAVIDIVSVVVVAVAVVRHLLVNAEQ